ncbi:hypothetical protein ZOSMA_1G02180 [Zostera marina]|uniref:Uncharacterized protein n=1 Tax=Zostera marina TaxID=29655 RepID=A0A0K9PPU8_ZOSMR|nr:hypothetical protein ZOSMA_1G02180 [Zostera marina]
MISRINAVYLLTTVACQLSQIKKKIYACQKSERFLFPAIAINTILLDWTELNPWIDIHPDFLFLGPE